MCKNKSFQSLKTKNELFKIQERKTKTKTIKKNSFDFRHFFRDFDKCYLFLKFKIHMRLPPRKSSGFLF